MAMPMHEEVDCRGVAQKERGEKKMDSLMTNQIIAIVVSLVLCSAFPWVINKWSDGRAQVR